MPFFTGDWIRCPELRVLPPDVRGLWMDMLCYMWESVERGVMVMPNGQPCTKEDVVRIIGTDSSGSTDWLNVLIENKVCEVREDGAIYSRRMVKDNLISEKRRLAGKKGGESTKAKVFIPKAEAALPTPQQQPDEVTDPPQLTPEQQEKVEKEVKDVKLQIRRAAEFLQNSFPGGAEVVLFEANLARSPALRSFLIEKSMDAE